jgi:hypothetical protein
MTRASDVAGPSGVVITGLYGVGKSTVVEEIAHLLEDAGIAFAALDLDWLWWFGVPGTHRSEAVQVLYRNVASVTRTYLDLGITHFALAWSPLDSTEVNDLLDALAFPVTVVELVAPLSVIDVRLRTAVTAGREDDRQEVHRWVDEGIGVGLGDAQISNDRPVRDVANEILGWLGWH